jgi:transposase
MRSSQFNPFTRSRRRALFFPPPPLCLPSPVWRLFRWVYIYIFFTVDLVFLFF